jgi:hypothetical protein
MPLFFWDASALVKRYTEEAAAETVDALFTHAPPLDMTSTPWGYAKTFSILLRRLNGGAIDSSSFATAVTNLQNEVVDNPDFLLLTIRRCDGLCQHRPHAAP